MNISVSPKDCKFIVKEQERKVVCVLKVNSHLAADFISDVDTKWLFNSFCDLRLASTTYVGIATCSPEDTWDEETGKLIAYIKAKEKFCRAFFNRLDFFFQSTDKVLVEMMDKCDQLGDHWARNIDANKQRVNQRLGMDIWGDD